jgi:hypothetical protein
VDNNVLNEPGPSIFRIDVIGARKWPGCIDQAKGHNKIDQPDLQEGRRKKCGEQAVTTLPI